MKFNNKIRFSIMKMCAGTFDMKFQDLKFMLFYVFLFFIPIILI